MSGQNPTDNGIEMAGDSGRECIECGVALGGRYDLRWICDPCDERLLAGAARAWGKVAEALVRSATRP